MEVNGKIPDINYAPFNSQASMVILVEQENGNFIHKYLDVDSEVTYITDTTEIVGTVLSANAIKETATDEMIVLPINSLIKTSDNFIGNTVINDDGNLDIKYTAEDMQVVVANQTISGFAMYGNINEEVVATGGMNIRVGRLSGIVDGISFYFNKGIDVLIETGGSSRRIDTIVIRKDQASRKVSVEVKKGDNTNTPQPLTQNFLGIYEIAICDVVVDVSNGNLAQNNITDRRTQFSYKLSRTGEIVAWAGNLETIPKNALLCDGREISRNYYMNMFNKLGVIWGAGNGTTTFNLPDGRSGTLKGIGSGVLDDPDKENRLSLNGSQSGNNVGSYQRYAFQYQSISHDHGVPTGREDHDWGMTAGGHNHIYDTRTRSVAVQYGTGNSTRDNNLAVHWIIFI